jgi:glycosyltransferase involved in cell wall biosynthesis
MTRPKRILMVAPTPYFSDRGCHVQIYEVARSQQLNGNDVRIVTYHHGRDIPGIPVDRIGSVPWYTRVTAGPSWHKLYLDLLLMAKTLEVARQFRPDILHVHMHEGAALALPVARLLGIPVVLDMQGSLTGELVNHDFVGQGTLLYRALHLIERAIHRHVDAILMWTYLNDALQAMFAFDQRKLHQVDYGVDTERFQPQPRHELGELRARLGIPAGRQLVVYLGTMSAYQGTDCLLETIPQVLRERPNTHFLIMGYPDVEVYQAMAERLGVAEHVTLPGRIEYSQAARYLSLGDLAISTKLTKMEGNGKLLNYLACGLPTVAFDLPGNLATLGDAGICVPLGDQAALAQAIVALLADEAHLRGLGEQARLLAESRYSWRAIGKTINGVYDGVLARPRTQRARLAEPRQSKA